MSSRREQRVSDRPPWHAPGIAKGSDKRSKGAGTPARQREIKRRWRDYETRAGNRPVRNFIASVSDEDAAEIAAGMREVRARGLSAARHLQEAIYEVRVDGANATYRILFAQQGSRGQILLALEAFKKKTQRTPPKTIALARRRLRDWENRGHGRNSAQPKKGKR